MTDKEIDSELAEIARRVQALHTELGEEAKTAKGERQRKIIALSDALPSYLEDYYIED
jgi:hypothetical protein